MKTFENTHNQRVKTLEGSEGLVITVKSKKVTSDVGYQQQDSIFYYFWFYVGEKSNIIDTMSPCYTRLFALGTWLNKDGTVNRESMVRDVRDSGALPLYKLVEIFEDIEPITTNEFDSMYGPEHTVSSDFITNLI